MSNFNFIGTSTPSAANTGACTFAGTTITTANDIADLGDVVYFKISDTQGAVGVCTNTGTTFNIDTNIYSNIPASFTPSLAYAFDEVTDLLYSDVLSYRVENSVSVATFSESYRPYRTKLNYKLIATEKIREFNGDLKNMLTTTWVTFKDSCDNHAYLVSFAEDAFVTLNNQLRSSLEFNIATR